MMSLLCLAPDIQEAILSLPVTERGRDVVTETQLRDSPGLEIPGGFPRDYRGAD